MPGRTNYPVDPMDLGAAPNWHAFCAVVRFVESTLNYRIELSECPMSRQSFKISIYALAALIALPMLGTACSKSPAASNKSEGDLAVRAQYPAAEAEPDIEIPVNGPAAGEASGTGYGYGNGNGAQDLGSVVSGAAADIKAILEILKSNNKCQKGYNKCATLKDSDFASIERNYDFGPVRNACYRPHQNRSSFCYALSEPYRRTIWGDGWRDALSPWGWDWPEELADFDDFDDGDLEEALDLEPAILPIVADDRAIEICRRGVDELVTPEEAYRILGFDIFNDFRGSFRGEFRDDDFFGERFATHLGRCRHVFEVIEDDDDFDRDDREGREGRDDRGGHEGRDDDCDECGHHEDHDDYGHDDYGHDSDYDNNYDNDNNECHHRDDCDHHEDCDCCPHHERGCDVDADCNDNNACTDDSCNSCTHVCVHATHLCNTNDCTTATCNPDTGCVYTAIPDCACTTNADCNDQNPCTNDLCGIIAPATTGICTHSSVNNGPIIDAPVVLNNLCIVSASCVNGSVANVVPLSCADENDCTTESCDPAIGCVIANAADGTTCFIGDGLAECVVYECMSGVCTVEVPANQCDPATATCITVCPIEGTAPAACVDISTDINNCGECGDKCGTFDVTQNACCAGSCVDTTSNPDNCGDCGLACGTGANADLPDCCESACTNLDLDPDNCGACGNACGGVIDCIDGCCGPQPDGEVCCGGSWVDLTDDPDNCGFCGFVCTGVNEGCCGDSTCGGC